MKESEVSGGLYRCIVFSIDMGIFRHKHRNTNDQIKGAHSGHVHVGTVSDRFSS